MGGEYMTNDEDCMVIAEEAIPECMERMAGTEDVGDRTKMEICLEEVNRDLVEYGEVESGSDVQECMCQGFLANRRTLEDASKLFCSSNGFQRNRRSLHYNGFMTHGGFQDVMNAMTETVETVETAETAALRWSTHYYQPTTPRHYEPTTTPRYYQSTTPRYYQSTTPRYY